MSRPTEATAPDALGVPRDDLPVLVTHLLLVVGIVFFGWSIGELLFVYAIEMGVTCLLFATAGLFAARPIDDAEADKWREEPTPIETSLLPPLYKRNFRLVGKGLFTGGTVVFIIGRVATATPDWNLSSVSSLPVALTVLAVCGSQAARVWVQFFAGDAYRNRSPVDALEIALRPVGRLFVIGLYVIAPVTVMYGVTTILILDAESASALPYGDTVVLLLYVLPIGAASVWLRNDRFEVSLSH